MQSSDEQLVKEIVEVLRQRLLTLFNQTPPQTTREARIMAIRMANEIADEKGHPEWADTIYDVYKELMGLTFATSDHAGRR